MFIIYLLYVYTYIYIYLYIQYIYIYPSSSVLEWIQWTCKKLILDRKIIRFLYLCFKCFKFNLVK